MRFVFPALLLSVLIGAIIGLGASWTNVAETWPTNEMSIRGETQGLLTGIAIAVPSGMGVALSVSLVPALFNTILHYIF